MDARFPERAKRGGRDPEPRADGEEPVGLPPRYRPLGLLGRGGGGRVWLAADEARGGVRVALKEMHPDALALGAELLAREFELLASLRHPNLVRVHDFDLERGFFTMDLVEGEALDRASLAEGELIEVIVQVLRALALLHARGLVHMDVKPQNVLVSRGAGLVRATLMDLGIAAERGGVSRGFTPKFAAPEVLRGERFDGRADLYALGCTWIAAAAGRGGPRPPTATGSSDPGAVTVPHGEAAPDAPPAWLELPEGLASGPYGAVLRRMLAADPSHRPASAAEVVAALGQAAGRSFPLETPETRSAAIAGMDLVGRDAELGELLDRWAAVQAGPGSSVLVVGEAGIGKSRLVRELVVRVQLEGAQTITLGADRDRSLTPIPELVQALLGEGDDHAEARAFFRATILEGARPTDGEVGSARARFRAEVAALLTAAASARPVLLVVEDVADADRAARSMLGELARLAPKIPGLLLVLTARTAEAPDRLRPSVHPLDPAPAEEADPALGAAVERVIALGPLAREPLERLVRVATGGPPPSRWFELSRGNPLFLGELLRSWAEGSPEEAPSRVEALVARRVGRLPPELAEVLAAAASLGPRFDPEVLTALGDPPTVRARLAALAARCCIAEEGPRARFCHALIYAAATALGPSLPGHRDRCRALARALVGTAPAQVARLHEAGEEPELAAQHFTAAAEAAIRVFDFEGAAELAERALRLDPRSGARIVLLRAVRLGGLGARDVERWSDGNDPEVRRELSRIALQRGDYRRALDLAAGLGDPAGGPLAADARRIEGLARYNLGDLPGALAALSAAVTLAEAAGDDVLVASVLNDRGLVFGYAANHRAAVEDHEAARARLGEDERAADDRAATLNNLGFALWALGRLEEAERTLAAALALRVARRDTWGEGVTRNNLGNVLRARGALGPAEAAYAQAIACCRSSQNRLYEAIAMNNLGQVLEEQGALERARGLYEAALAIARALGDKIREGDNLGNLGQCLLRAGLVERARAQLAEAVAFRAALGDETYRVLDLSHLAVAHLAAGEAQAAEAAADEAVAILGAGLLGVEQVQAVFLNAHHVYRALGRADDARAALARAVAALEAQASGLGPSGRRALLAATRANREIAALAGLAG